MSFETRNSNHGCYDESGRVKRSRSYWAIVSGGTVESVTRVTARTPQGIRNYCKKRGLYVAFGIFWVSN